ncbi:MAG: hypothetical protein WA957_01415 [Alteraurantiacibacter sp.]
MQKTSALLLVGASLVVGVTAMSQSAEQPSSQWRGPGDEHVIGDTLEFFNADGRPRLINTGELINTAGHPFFEPLGEDGRACVTCHQPSNAMSMSVKTICAQWDATDGKEPLFAVIDGPNCPSLPQGEEASHSLLLTKGLLRIPRPWPPKAA